MRIAPQPTNRATRSRCRSPYTVVVRGRDSSQVVQCGRSSACGLPITEASSTTTEVTRRAFQLLDVTRNRRGPRPMQLTGSPGRALARSWCLLLALIVQARRQ